MPGSGRSGGLFLFPAPEKQRIVSRCSLHILPPGGNGTGLAPRHVRWFFISSPVCKKMHRS
ncbi:hypothetical protein DWUX_1479 [Desulfovibrio diazotrophicus]|nr:hypothetical protein DWUX_1479 [Desulfovibrio diazotrophicus]